MNAGSEYNSLVKYILRVGILGNLVFVSFLLTLIAFFSANWFSYQVSINQSFGVGGVVFLTVGILPFDSDFPGWGKGTCVLMYLTLALFFPFIGVFVYSARKVYTSVEVPPIRWSLLIISILSGLISIFQFVAFILIAANCGSYNNQGLTLLDAGSFTVGSCPILALFSSILTGIVTGACGYYSFNVTEITRARKPATTHIQTITVDDKAI